MPAHHAGKKRLGGNRGASGFPRAVTPPLASLRSVLVGLARLPLLQLLLGLVLADAVRVLDLANQLVAITGDPVQVVVGELAPLLLHFALHLLPVAFDAVPVHCVSFRGGAAGNAFVIPAHAVQRSSANTSAASSCRAVRASCSVRPREFIPGSSSMKPKYSASSLR